MSMEISGFSPHIFWSYDRSASLPEEVVIKQVVIYGEVKDKIMLAKMLGKQKISHVIDTLKEKEKEKAEKHISFMQKIILA